MFDSLVSHPFLTALALTLCHFLWQGLLIALLLKVLLSCISYQKSQLRYALSAAAMVLNLLIPIATLFVIYHFDYQQVSIIDNSAEFTNSKLTSTGLHASNWYGAWGDYLPFITLAWVSIVSILATKLLIELYSVNQLPKYGTYPAQPALQLRFEQLMAKMSLAKSVHLHISTQVDVPMAIGWIKPVVLLPVTMISGLTPQQLDMLLLHELAHIRRHDYLVNFLQTLVEILLFFHPAVRWVSKQMRNEREYCSDDIAVAHAGDAMAYAHTLADTASLCQQHHRHAIPAMAMAASGGDLKQRVTRLLDQTPHCSHHDESGKWLASLTILFVITSTLLQQSLPVPVIDMQSGSIRLYQSNDEQALLTPANNIQQASTQVKSPLAQQLVEMASPAKENSSVSVSEYKPAKPHLDTLATPKNQSAKMPIITNDLPIVLNRKSQSLSNSSPITSSNNETLLASKTSTLSENAFARTDSNNQQASLPNPYAQQIRELANENTAQRNDHADKRSNNNNNDSVNKAQLAVSFSTPSIDHMLTELQQSVTANKPASINTTVAKLLTATEPKYPITAKRRGIELDVKVNFTIDKQGYIRDIRFESKGKVNYFRKNIRSALSKWRFLPAKQSGQPVESKMSKIFSFSLLS